MISVSVVILGWAVLGLIWWRFKSSSKSKMAAPLPPGPPAVPILGHAHLVPRSRPEDTFIEWGKHYNSDIIYLNLFGKDTVVLNSIEAATTLLERRGANYSERPVFHFLEEQGWKNNVALFSQGTSFRKHRRAFNTAFTPTNCIPHREHQMIEARKLVGRLSHTPSDWESEITKYGTDIVLRIAYGFAVEGEDDPYLELADKLIEAMTQGGAAGATLIDIFPFIRKFPQWMNWMTFLKQARSSVPIFRKLRDMPVARVEKEMAGGVAGISFTRTLLEQRAREKEEGDHSYSLSHEEIKGASATVFAAGQETTGSTIVMFMLAMLKNPQVQRKAWEEIEAVIGHERLPTFEDRDRLPYISNILNETFRWNSVLPTGMDLPCLPHKSHDDDIYKGYFIPKGTTIIANVFAINRDPTRYRNPDEFIPERFISIEEGGAGEPLPVGQFGFGRRICPGQHLAAAALYILFATMLATLEFSIPRDKEGNEIELDYKWMTGLTSRPNTFPCTIKPRSPEHAALLQMR